MTRIPRRDEYRRRVNPNGAWHFRRECRNYPPIDGTEVKRDKPPGAKLCKRCLVMEKARR